MWAKVRFCAMPLFICFIFIPYLTIILTYYDNFSRWYIFVYVSFLNAVSLVQEKANYNEIVILLYLLFYCY